MTCWSKASSTWTKSTHRMDIDDFEEAVQLAMEGNCGKVVLDF